MSSASPMLTVFDFDCSKGSHSIDRPIVVLAHRSTEGWNSLKLSNQCSNPVSFWVDSMVMVARRFCRLLRRSYSVGRIYFLFSFRPWIDVNRWGRACTLIGFVLYFLQSLALGRVNGGTTQWFSTQPSRHSTLLPLSAWMGEAPGVNVFSAADTDKIRRFKTSTSCCGRIRSGAPCLHAVISVLYWSAETSDHPCRTSLALQKLSLCHSVTVKWQLHKNNVSVGEQQEAETGFTAPNGQSAVPVWFIFTLAYFNCTCGACTLASRQICH